MPRPRDLGLRLDAPAPEAEKMKITDTMTLVVADGQGRELRVKERGMLKGDATPAAREQQKHSPAPQGALLGQVNFEDLRIGEVVGAGSQGRVRKVQHKGTHEILALKSLTFSDDMEATREAVRHELVRIEAIKHENIVSSYEAYFRDGKLYILMEFMDAGTMMNVLKRRDHRGFPENRLSMVAKHLFLGLAHLHASHIVHRDIKPVNLLANSKGLAKISDFGVASSGEARMLMTSVGSTPYMSPERIKGSPYNTSSDIWSAGLTLAELAIGRYPLGDVKGKIFDLCQMIAAGNVTIRWDLAQHEISEELKDLVSRCLKANPDERPPAAELLQHKFMTFAGNLTTADMGSWYLNPVD